MTPGIVLLLSASAHAFQRPTSTRYSRKIETSAQRYRLSALAGKQGRPASSDADDFAPSDISRRDALCALSVIFAAPQVAKADLIQFPCKPGDLKNNYSFLRAGESLIEADGLWGSNPLFLTNRENALSENGIAQIQAACADMMERDFNPSVVLFPTAANAIDTADIVASEMRIGRNRVLPEYTNLDGRTLSSCRYRGRCNPCT